jgi:tRNA(Ile)-lysidine synthase
MADDQNETVAMRLNRRSGLRGLEGIAPLRFYKGALFARPFLSYSKIDLSQLCTLFGVNFISDPSNQNRMFERVRWRRLLAADPDLSRQLSQLSRAASSLSEQLEGQIEAWINAHVRVFARLRASCPYAVFSAQPEAHRHHILAALLAICGHSSFPPSMDAYRRA